VAEITNAERTRHAFELWNARRFDALLDMFHPDAIWDMREIGAPDMAEFRGHEGLRRFFDEWLAAFPDSSIEVEDVATRGPWSIATILQQVSGSSSHVPVPFHYYGIGRWRDGKLEFVENHIDRERGFEAFDAYSAAPAP
jgi:ketosteroid isomerase-like protein